MDRTALYARYSDPVQNPRSCEDQVALLTAHAAKKAWTVVASFSDPEISGSAMANRPGLLALLAAADAGAFDVVLVEHQDRLARNLEHEAHVFNRLKARGVRIATLATDQVTLMHVAVGGLMGELYLEVLSDKTKRGMHQNAERGLATGARIYGYRSQPGGEMAIVAEQADVVREIFDRYGRGESLREVTAALNARGVPSPAGGRWAPSTITGSRQRGNGVLRLELYRGVKVWNRFRMTKDRSTGRRISNPIPPAEWKRTPVPALRIVSDEAWAAVEVRLQAAGEKSPFARRSAPPQLFSGLIRCADCGAAMTTFNSRGRLICAARRAHGPTACGNAFSVPRSEIEQRVLEGLRTRLLSPAAVRAYVRAYHDAWTAQQAASANTLGPLRRRLSELDRTIARLVDRICDGTDTPATNARLQALEAERVTTAERITQAEREAPPPVTLHPRLGEVYANRIAELQAHLAAHGARANAGQLASADLVTSLRAMVQKIEVRALPVGLGPERPVQIRLLGTLAAFLTEEEAVSRAAGPGLSLDRLRKLVAGGGHRLDQTLSPSIPIAC